MGGIESLTLYAFYVLLGQALGALLSQFLDVGYIVKLLKRWHYSNRLKKGKFCDLTQRELNEIYEGAEVTFFFRYGNIIRIYFVAVFFSYILPIGPLVCLLYLILQFWLDKFMIIRRYKTIVRLNSELSVQMLEFAELSLFLFTFGNVFFHFAVTKSIDRLELVTLIISIIVIFVPVMETAKRCSTKKQLLRPRIVHDNHGCPTRQA